MASTIAYPSNQEASRASVLAWIAENAPDAEIVTFDEKQFADLENSMPPNVRFMSCAEQKPAAHRVGLTYEREPTLANEAVLAYWVGHPARKD